MWTGIFANQIAQEVLKITLTPSFVDEERSTETAAANIVSSIGVTIVGGAPPFTVSVIRVSNNTEGGSGILSFVNSPFNTSEGSITFTSSATQNQTIDRSATFKITVRDPQLSYGEKEISIRHNYAPSFIA